MSTFPDVKKNFGFGCMRLPMDGEKVDYAEFTKMVDEFMAQGFNYFDTARVYIGGQGETAIRDCVVKRYPRDSFILTDKLSDSLFNSEDEIRPLFEKQLESCGVDYFDFYLFHNVYERNVGPYLDPDNRVLEYLLRQKEAGRTRHWAFSAPGSRAVIQRFLDAYGEYRDFGQLQLNSRDGDFQGARAKAEELNRRTHATEQFALGARRFCVGLAKKVLLANAVGKLWDECLAAQGAGTLTMAAGWLGLVA